MNKDSIPQLDRRGLRRFGLVTGAILAGLFGLLLPWLLGFALPIWPWIIAAILSTWALLAPASLEPVYLNWMRFGLLLNRVTTPLILGVVFYLLIFPMGLLMRLFGGDPMRRKADPATRSYRVKSRQSPSQNMERPF